MMDWLNCFTFDCDATGKQWIWLVNITKWDEKGLPWFSFQLYDFIQENLQTTQQTTMNEYLSDELV